MAEDTPRFWHGWRQRAAALRNIPALMRLVWESGPAVVTAGWAFRITAALIPLAMLSVSKWILDGVQVKSGGGSLVPGYCFIVISCLSIARLASGEDPCSFPQDGHGAWGVVAGAVNAVSSSHQAGTVVIRLAVAA